MLEKTNNVSEIEIPYAVFGGAFLAPEFELGQGSYGVVYKWTWGNKEIAVKGILNLYPSIWEKFKQEMKLMPIGFALRH